MANRSFPMTKANLLLPALRQPLLLPLQLPPPLLLLPLLPPLSPPRMLRRMLGVRQTAQCSRVLLPQVLQYAPGVQLIDCLEL